MNVAVTTLAFGPYVGGVEEFIGDLAAELSGHGVTSHVLTNRFQISRRSEPIRGGRVIRLAEGGRRDRRTSMRYVAESLAWLARHRHEIDLVHAHGPFSTLTVAFLARVTLGIPFVSTIHSTLPAGVTSGPMRDLVRTELESGKTVLVHELLEPSIADMGCSASNVSVIHNGVPRPELPGERERAILRRQHGIEEGRTRAVLFCGRLVEVKRPLETVEVFARLRERVPNTLLLVAGDGDLRSATEARANELGVLDAVQFLGLLPRDELNRVMQAADLFLNTSEREGLSVAMLEATMAGLPIVAYKVGGNGIVVENGLNGFLTPPHDVGRMAGVLVENLGDTGRLASLRQGALQKRTAFAISTTAERYLALYGEAARQRDA